MTLHSRFSAILAGSTFLLFTFQNCARLSSGIATTGSAGLGSNEGTTANPVLSSPAGEPAYQGRFEFADGPDAFGKDYGRGRNRARID